MPIEQRQMLVWQESARRVIESVDVMAAGELAREAVPRLIAEVNRLSEGSERDRIAVLMAQALVTGLVANGEGVTLMPADVAVRAYTLADALLGRRGG